MHGVVHAEFRQYAIGRLGSEGWSDVVRSAGLVHTAGYSPVTTYPDEDFLGLLLAFGRATGEPLEGVLTDFGRAVLGGLFDTYSAFIEPRWDAADVLENVERVIHRTVRLQDAAATPPHLKVERLDADVVVIQYTSPRRLCAFGKGLVHGLADRFDQRADIDEPSCMHRGDEACVLRITLREAGRGRPPSMETPRDDDPDRPDEIDQTDALESSEYGELDDDRQKNEWKEDSAEGGEKR